MIDNMDKTLEKYCLFIHFPTSTICNEVLVRMSRLIVYNSKDFFGSFTLIASVSSK